MFRSKSIRMLVCDMAGTTIQEKGIVYNSLYKTVKLIKPKLMKSEIEQFSGYNKLEVIKYFVEQQKMDSPTTVINNLDSEFNYYLKKEYSNNASVKLIHPALLPYFNVLRYNDIKICLNTGYNKDIQNLLIDKLGMLDYIDDYISSEEVDRGRPYPYMINRLMARNDIDNPKEVIKIGDSVADIKEGINAGCNTVAVLSGAGHVQDLSKEKPDFILNSIMDLRFY